MCIKMAISLGHTQCSNTLGMSGKEEQEEEENKLNAMAFLVISAKEKVKLDAVM